MTCDDRRAEMEAKRLNQPVEYTSNSYIKTRSIGPQKWVVGVTVAYRERPTIKRTVESIRNAGFKQILLFCEPASNDLPDSQHHPTITCIIRNDETLGNWGNFKRRTRWLTEMYVDSSTKFLLAQDDVDFLPGTRRWVEDNWPCNGGPISLYRSAKYPPTPETYSVLKQGEPFLGILAVAVDRNFLCSLDENAEAMNDGKSHQDDMKFGRFCNGINVPVNMVCASKCQHTGVISSTYPHTTIISTLRKADTYVEMCDD